MVKAIITTKDGASGSKEFGNMAQALAYAYANGAYYAAAKIEFINTELITPDKGSKAKSDKPKEEAAAPDADANETAGQEQDIAAKIAKAEAELCHTCQNAGTEVCNTCIVKTKKDGHPSFYTKKTEAAAPDADKA